MPPTQWAGRLDDDDHRERHSPEQVVRRLAQADRMLGEGKDVAMADWAHERVGLAFIPPGRPGVTATASRLTAGFATSA